MITTAHTQLYDLIAAANDERVYNEWHASALAMCPRAHYFKRLGVPSLQTPTAPKVIRWSAGHLLEESIRPHIANLYHGVTSNVRLTSEKLDLTGEYDNYAEDDHTIIEVKSVHDFAIISRDGVDSLKKQVFDKEGYPVLNKWGKPTYEPLLTPYLHHEIQEHAYVLLLAEQGKAVKFIDYVYITLSGRIVTYSTEVNPGLLQGVERRITQLNDAWAKQEPPACICIDTNPLWGSVLQWCEYRNDGDVCCNLDLISLVKKENTV